MKKIIKNTFLVLIITICITFFYNNISQAALQANSSTHSKCQKSSLFWIKEIRKMEELNGTLGLNEEFNDDYTYKGESNKIDMHMMKNTEYGAIAILAVSGYGNPSNANVLDSTTGNDTGIIDGNTENSTLVAAVAERTDYYGVNSMYYDYYTFNKNSAKIGDATVECWGWHGASPTYWFLGSHPGLERIGIGRMGYNYGQYARYSRGVAVCGEGL